MALRARIVLLASEGVGITCQTYRLAPEGAAAGIPTFNIDEMTGIQTLERIATTLNETMAKPFRWTYQAKLLTV